jgi:ABC-type antimicrobial peptide transport system permease subunit
MARQFFGDENPVGRRLFNVDDHSKMTIVGVIRDTIYNRLDQEPPPTLYVPYLQGGIGGATFEVRAVQQPGSLVAGIRNVVARADSKVPLSDLRTQEEQIYESVSQQRLFARLSTFFGSLTLLLVFVGIYAHMNHAVTQRMHEIGVRMALGAEPFHVLRMILGESSRLLVYGAAVGVGAAIVTTRLLNSFLFGLKPNDPSTIVASVVLIVATSVLATYFPARRAMRVDPMAALHYE